MGSQACSERNCTKAQGSLVARLWAELRYEMARIIRIMQLCNNNGIINDRNTEIH